MGDYGLKHADNTGDNKSKPQQNHKPWKALANAFAEGLMQILLRGETGQLGVIIAHLIIDKLCDVL